MISHGSVSINWSANLLKIDTHGPFNEEGVTAAFKEIKGSVRALAHPKWVRLDRLDEQTLGSPEVMAVIAENYLWGYRYGCQATAVICSHIVQVQILDGFIRQSGVNMKSFDSVNEAEAWLLSCL